MTAEKDKSLSPTMLKARNEILVKFGDYTFEHALDEVKSLLKNEKNNSTRLALLAAKSWIIRNKVYAMMNEPFVYSLNELENTNIFSGSEEDLGGDLDGLFDDDVDVDENVEVSIIKAITHGGVKITKDTVIKVSKGAAEKLISEKKAKYLD
jgi:hypothetical protein